MLFCWDFALAFRGMLCLPSQSKGKRNSLFAKEILKQKAELWCLQESSHFTSTRYFDLAVQEIKQREGKIQDKANSIDAASGCMPLKSVSDKSCRFPVLRTSYVKSTIYLPFMQVNVLFYSLALWLEGNPNLCCCSSLKTWMFRWGCK